jgi:hypothetical protein
MTKQAEAAAEQIFSLVFHGRCDETGRLTPGIARIIAKEYEAREKAVAELVAIAESVLYEPPESSVHLTRLEAAIKRYRSLQ